MCYHWNWLLSIYESSWKDSLHVTMMARAILTLSPPKLGSVRVIKAMVWVSIGWLICWLICTSLSLTPWQSDDMSDWFRLGLRK